MRLLARHPLALALATAILGAAWWATPPLVDAVTGSVPGDADLFRPLGYVLFAPASDVLDSLTFLTLGRAQALLATWMVAAAAWGALAGGTRRRRIIRATGGVVAVLLVAAAAVLLPRPVPRIVTADPALAVLDYHAHTAASHDGRPGWSLERLGRWHARQGFTGSYVTDHNIVSSGADTGGITLLPGVEWSLYRLHLVAVGPVRDIDRRIYGGDVAHLLAVFPDLHRQGAVTIASLPEYWRNHRESLYRFVAAGLDGFEIVNCSPKGLAFDEAARRDVIRLAQATGRLVVAASDNHGWGMATCAWNLTAPGAVGTATNRVLARSLALRQGDLAAWHAGVTQPWEMLRALTWPERIAWLTWIALIAIYRGVPRRRDQARGLGVLARSLGGRDRGA